MTAPSLEDTAAHRRLLKAYAAGFRTGLDGRDAHIDLKRDHCLRVMDEAAAIVSTLGLEPADEASCLLAALYHDVGRFEQLRSFGTFNDSQSVNHGALGARVLGCESFLDALEPDRRCLVRAAVAVHNRRFFPRAMEPRAALAARVVRDADKLDIFPVVMTHLTPGGVLDPVVVLGVADDPERYTSQILADVMAGRLADYHQMAWTNDFKLLLLSWVHAMHFPAALRTLAERGYVRDIMADLPDSPEFLALGERLEGLLDAALSGQGL